MSPRLRPASAFLGAIVCARRAWVWIFAAYAAALFTATHWPNLTIDSTYIERPDLIIHLASFGLWTFLLGLSGLCGAIDQWRTLPRIAIVALVHAAFDESTQAIPFVRRHFALDDMLANFSGVTLGLLALVVVCAVLRRWSVSRPAPRVGEAA